MADGDGVVVEPRGLVRRVGGVDEIQASTTYLLMEGARRLDEAKAASRARVQIQENKL